MLVGGCGEDWTLYIAWYKAFCLEKLTRLSGLLYPVECNKAFLQKPIAIAAELGTELLQTDQLIQWVEGF